MRRSTGSGPSYPWRCGTVAWAPGGAPPLRMAPDPPHGPPSQRAHDKGASRWLVAVSNNGSRDRPIDRYVMNQNPACVGFFSYPWVRRAERGAKGRMYMCTSAGLAQALAWVGTMEVFSYSSLGVRAGANGGMYTTRPI